MQFKRKFTKNIIVTPLSALLPVKNVGGVIAAFALLLLPGWQLVIVGDGEEKKRLIELSRERGVSKSVIFVGEMDHREALRTLSRAKIFVLNSYHEGMPHSILEAWSKRVPVVATDIPGIREIVRENDSAVIVPAGNDKELANAIKKVAKNPKLSKSLADNGWREYRNNYTWEKHLDKLQAVFREITE